MWFKGAFNCENNELKQMEKQSLRLNAILYFQHLIVILKYKHFYLLRKEIMVAVVLYSALRMKWTFRLVCFWSCFILFGFFYVFLVLCFFLLHAVLYAKAHIMLIHMKVSNYKFSNVIVDVNSRLCLKV